MTAGSAVLLITYYFSPQLLTLRIFAMDRDLLYFFLGVGFLILYYQWNNRDRGIND
jgi:hypothetical protein